jgi:peptidyl-tRNA hydrolase
MNKLYLIVRNDLDPGLQAAQMAQVALEYAVQVISQGDRPPKDVILLQVPDEEALTALARSMAHFGCELECRYEAGVSGKPTEQLTAIACSAFLDGSGDSVERFVGSLPCALRPPKAQAA